MNIHSYAAKEAGTFTAKYLGTDDAALKADPTYFVAWNNKK